MELLETHKSSEKISCQCGKHFNSVVYRRINLSTDPDLLEDLLSGELNQVKCSKCNRKFYSDTPIALHDPENELYACLYPEDWRSKELSLRIEFYQELMNSGGANAPGYVRDASFLFGLDSFNEQFTQDVDATDVVESGPSIQELEESDFEQVVDVERVDRRDSALVAKWKESGQDYYAFLDEGALHIFQRHLAPEQFGVRADLFFQLHRIENFPLVVMLLVAEGRNTTNQVLYWLYNLDNRVDVQFLEHLAQRFEVSLHLFDHEYVRRRTMLFSPPLEQNVDYVLEQAREWMDKIDPRRRNFFIAASKFDETAYYKLGRGRPSLDASAFEELTYPSVTKLAVDILTYWSFRENYEYLIFIKSFPVSSFKTILLSVLKQAIEFGLAMTEKLKRMAVEMGLVRSKEDLLERLLINFAEVVAGLKPNDMDPVAMLEIWQQHTKDAHELGVEIKPQISELIETIKSKVDESRRVIPLDLSDDVEMLGALDQLPEGELRDLLKDREHRAEALRALAEIANQDLFPDVSKVFARLTRTEIDAIGDALGGFGEVAREFIEKNIEGRRGPQAIGALRALARLDGGKAADRLMAEVQKGRAGVWQVAADLLSGLDDPPMDKIVKASRDADPSVRGRLIPVLTGFGQGAARKRLEEMAETDQADRVRFEARLALGPAEGQEPEG